MKINKILTKFFSASKKKTEEQPVDIERIAELPDKIKRLSPYLLWFENHLTLIFHPQNDVNSFIKEAEKYTDQIEVEKDKNQQFINELWMLRYAFSYNFFLNVMPPKNQNDLEDILTLLESATKQTLNKIGKIDYLPIFRRGLEDYNINQLTFGNFKNFNSQFARNVSDKIPLIIFECTGGILGGKRYDDINKLIEILVDTDKKALELGKIESKEQL